MKKPRLLNLKVLLLALVILVGYTDSFGENKEENPIEIHFINNGNQMHGWFYKATGNGPFTTVIILQGSVGQDGDIFNLGENLSSEGFNVMTYNYPGSWRSEGIRTDESALYSVQSAIDFVKSESSINLFKTDSSDIVLLGYSYGASMALLGSVLNQNIKKVITIAGGDLSVTADNIEQNPKFREYFQQMIDQLLLYPNIVRGSTGKDYVQSLLNNRDKYNLKKYSQELSEKHLLFIVGWLDQEKRLEDNMLPLYREIQVKGADHAKIIAFDTDHRITYQQKEITETIINWLKKKNE